MKNPFCFRRIGNGLNVNPWTKWRRQHGDHLPEAMLPAPMRKEHGKRNFGRYGVFWSLECFVDYALPGIIWGYGAADTAIQSVRSCSSIVLPLSLYECLVSCCLLRLCAYLVLYSVSVVLCRFLHSSNRAFTICIGIYIYIYAD